MPFGKGDLPQNQQYPGPQGTNLTSDSLKLSGFPQGVPAVGTNLGSGKPVDLVAGAAVALGASPLVVVPG